MKETFIIRSEWWGSISLLTEKEQAIILKNLFEYHHGHPEKVDLSTVALRLVWGLIEPNLKRNIDNYDRRCETSAKNGLLGGRPPKNAEPKKPNSEPNLPTEPNMEKPNKPKKTLNEYDSDSVSDSGRGNEPDVSANALTGAEAPGESPEAAGFKRFQDWVKKNAERVSKMKEPFTISQYIEVKSKYKNEDVKQLLKEMHNYTPLLSKNQSAYLTLLSWLKRRHENPLKPVPRQDNEPDVMATLKKVGA